MGESAGEKKKREWELSQVKKKKNIEREYWKKKKKEWEWEHWSQVKKKKLRESVGEKRENESLLLHLNEEEDKKERGQG